MSCDEPGLRFAIADPPYLGRAALWYGGEGRNRNGYNGRACGRSEIDPEYHPEASRWDDPQRHNELMLELESDFDGWALAASAKTVTELRIPERSRIAIWRITNAIPDGSRVRATWEAVIVRVPDSRRAHGTGAAVVDVLEAPHPMSGFVGTKPAAWTRWVIDMLGFRPGHDELVDLFPGSGAISHAASVLF